MMRKISLIFFFFLVLISFSFIHSCNTRCVDEVLLQTIKMDLQVNSNNLGISVSAPMNSVDTIRSETHQFYNYPEFRRFGYHKCIQSNWLISSAIAQSDCPEQTDYISRMDAEKTSFSLNTNYDANALGLGIISAGTDLLKIEDIKQTYLSDFINNSFLNGGAPTPLTISKNFFQPISDQMVTFYFTFVEIDGSVFMDSVQAYVDISF